MHNGTIDLRSDTVTRPTPGMRRAMAEAEVGDDVFGEDPTVNALEEEMAAFFGKEAALFVSSGTMANQVSLKAQTQPGDEVVAHPQAHIVRAESAAAAAISGVQFRMVGNANGSLSVAEVEAVLQTGYDPHFAPTRLICLENTHNFAGGRIVPMEDMAALSELARRKGIGLHLDGARLLNACVARDWRPDKVAAHFDSLTLCFSKGLGAPVGSIIAGKREFIRACRRYRKMFGGGLRQSGILAAAARYAMSHHVARLAEDHANALTLAAGIAAHKQLKLSYGLPDTNLVFFESRNPEFPIALLHEELKQRGVQVVNMNGRMARAVTHLDVTSQDIGRALEQIHAILPS
jgi:threonine aldolase